MAFDPNNSEPISLRGSDIKSFDPSNSEPVRKVGTIEAALRTAAQASQKVVRFFDMGAAGLAHVFGDTAGEEDILKQMDFRQNRMSEAYAEKPNEEFGAGGRFLGTVAGLPATVLGGPGSAYANRAADVIDRGGSLAEANDAGKVSAAVNTAMMLVPAGLGFKAAQRAGAAGLSAAKSMAVGGATGAALGTAAGVAGRAVESASLPGGEQFNDLRHAAFDPEAMATDALLSLGFGAHGGKVAHAKGKTAAKAKVDAAVPEFPASQFQDLGDGIYRAPNGAPITKEQWAGSSKRLRDGWLKPREPEQTLPVGETKDISVDEAVQRAQPVDTAELDKAIAENPESVIAKEASDEKARRLKESEAKVVQAQQRADAAALRRAATQYADAGLKARLLKKADVLDPPAKKLPVGELREGQPEIKVDDNPIPIGEAKELPREPVVDNMPTEPLPTGEATEVTHSGVEPHEVPPVGEVKELYIPPEKQHALGEIAQQDRVQTEREAGTQSGQTSESGGSDSVQHATEGTGQKDLGEHLDLNLPKIEESMLDHAQRAENRKAAPPDERGRRHVAETIDRGVAEGKLNVDAAGTLKWLLEKNPNLARGVRMEVHEDGGAGLGSYASADRVVKIFKGNNAHTAPHEFLHAVERLLPEKIQRGIRREWRLNLEDAVKAAKTPMERDALNHAKRAIEAGTRESRDAVIAAFKSGVLNKDKHYKLTDPSEFWAVNGPRILAAREHASRNSWVTQARQFMRELVEHVKGTLGVRSDSAVLSALNHITNPRKTNGERSNGAEMLVNGERQDMRAASHEALDITAPPESKTLPEDTKKSRVEREVFDSLNRVEAAQRASGIHHEDADMRLAMRLNLGRVQARTDHFESNTKRPLEQALKSAAKEEGLTVRDADDYAAALHAPERNAVIAERDPKNKSGSGITDEQAKDIIDSFTPAQRYHLDKIAGLVREMNNQKLDAMVEDGLITPEARDRMNKQFKNYVPLKTLEEEANFTGAGRGYQTWANDIHAATGRTSRAGSPIASSIMDATRAITRGERARVNKVIWNFANHPDAKEIMRPYDPKQPPKEVMGKELDADGKAHEVVDRRKLDDLTVPLVVDGHPERVFVPDPALKEALATAGTPQQLGNITRALSKATRTFSRTLTEWNFAFAPVNQVKDIGTAAIRAKRLGISALDLTPEKIVKAQATVISHMAGKRTGDAAMYDEMVKAGGKTGGYGLTNLADTMSSLEKMGADLGYEDHKGGVPRKVAKVGEAVAEGLSHYNEVFEYSTRFAAYKAARKNGMSPKRAAEVARKITVDFNVSGNLGRKLGHAYVFANAALQGLHGDAHDLISTKTRYRMLSLIGLGIAVQAYNELYGGMNEETGDKNVDSQSDSTLDNNITLLKPDGRSGAKIPLPPGLATGLYTMGRRIARMGTEGNVEREATGMLSAAVQSVMPLRMAEGANQITNVLQAITPYVIRPAADISVNSNQFGMPIVPKSKDTRSPPPSYLLARKSTSDIAKQMSKFANELTGGDSVKPGASQRYLGDFVSPEAIEHMVGYYTGGVGQLAMQSKNIIKNAAEGKPQDINKIPVARRFAFTEPEGYIGRRYHELQSEYEYAKDYDKAGESEKISPRIQATREKYLETDKVLGGLFKELRAAVASGDDTDPIQQRIKAAQAELIKAYNSTSK